MFLENKDNLMLDFFLDSNLGHNAEPSASLSSMTQKSSGESVTFGDGKVATIFTAINKNLSPELVKRTGAIFQFNVKGTLTVSKCNITVCAKKRT